MPTLADIDHFAQLIQICTTLYQRYGLNFDRYLYYAPARTFLGSNFADEDPQAMKDFLITHRNALRGQSEALMTALQDMLVIESRTSFFALNHVERSRAAEIMLNAGVTWHRANVREAVEALDAALVETTDILDLVAMAVAIINIYLDAQP